MAKNKGKGQAKVRKRKLTKTAESLASEETSSSSQSQDSLGQTEDTQPKAKYIPRFGNTFKKARLDLSKEKLASVTHTSQVQEDSCTQPVGQVADTLLDQELVSATQPVHTPQAETTVSQSHHANSDPAPTSCQTVPGFSLSQAEIMGTPTNSLPSAGCEDELKSGTGSDTPTALPIEQMNLDLLNPFSCDEDSNNHDTPPVVTPVLKLKMDHITTVDTPSVTKGVPLLVNQPIEDATLPNSQELPDSHALTDDQETLYDDKNEGKVTVMANGGLEMGSEIKEFVEEEDRLMKEMMGLRAEDLMESQLGYANCDNATVPSLSPAREAPQREAVEKQPSSGHKPAYTFNQPTATSCREGGSVLRGLIQELSSINQYILRCKRELESARKQRETWLRTRQPHHR